MTRLSLTTVALAALLPGCSDDDPVAFSDTVSVKMSGIKEGDISSGSVSRDKGISTESGNPYGEFLKDAEAALGRAPGAIGVTRIDLRVFADTTGVTRIDEVFGSVEVFVADGETTLPIGTISGEMGSSVRVPVSASPDDLEPLQDKLIKGDFKVGVRGPTVHDGATKFDLKITVDIAFEALP